MGKALSVIAGCGLGLAVLAAGCSSGPGGSAASSSAGPGVGGSHAGGTGPALVWSSCPQVAPRLQCASLKVPLNYAQPAGRKITLALTRLPATAPPGQRLGALLVNPGGPGGSGRTMAAYVGEGLDPAVAARYDIIGFDTRGTGASVPALHCDRSFFARPRPDYIPASKAAERAMISRARGYAAACQRTYGWLLPYMTSRDMARDLDSIRVALGQRQISYFAYSYGTYLGQVYATMFPDRVRRMVLDSTVDPGGVWYTDNLQQDYAFQGRIEAFFSWTARYDASYRLGGSAAAVSQSWHAARRQLAARPVSGPAGPLVGPDEFDDTFLAGGYNDQYWPGLAAALASYLHQANAGPMRRLYTQIGRQDENEFAVYNAVECSDAAWPRSWARWDADARKIYKTAPYEAWDNTWFNAACAFWPVRAPRQPMKIGAPGLPGILMLQGTGDGATPYSGAVAARRTLPSARMVVVDGGGNHGQSLASPPNTCVNNYLNRYLASGALPGGTGLVSARCPAGPLPVP